MIINGSLSYSYSGRKRKTVKSSKRRAVFEPVKVERPVYIRETKHYPSCQDKACNVSVKEESFRKEVSAKYTVAPAYNKGAYQVISRDNVKDIGK